MATRAATINDPYIRVSHPAPARAVGTVRSCQAGPPRPQLAAQVCHAFTCRMKVAQSAEAKIRLGPSGSLESRTATMPGRLVATSTHWPSPRPIGRSEEHTSELQSHLNLVCRLLLEKKK